MVWYPNMLDNVWAHLGVVYTMDHEVVPRHCTICDWLLKFVIMGPVIGEIFGHNRRLRT
jgi:hypothetical protein